MKRPTLIWILFACCLLVGLGAMGWVSLKALQLDVNEARNRQAAEMEDNMRSALWRMDSSLGWLVAQENARPYFVYNTFFPAERVSPRGMLDRKNGDLLVPSPLLNQLPDFVLLHFEISPDGVITSPQAPTGNVKVLAESQYSTPDRIGEAAQRLVDLRQIVSREALANVLPKVKDQPDMPLALNRSSQFSNNGNNTVQSNAGNNKLFLNPPSNFRFNDNNNGDQIVQRGQEDYQARAQSIRNTTDAQALQNRYIDQNFTIASVSVNEGVMKPVWVGDALVLARHVSIGGHDYIQGCWIDWPAMKASLLQSVASFLPDADLHKVRNVTDDKQPHMLAALPVRLVVPAAQLSVTPSSPIRITLLVAWGSAIVGAAAIAMLLGGVMSLSNRRAAFVSAVTHELRTPLTTLRMYTEMLSDGMVRDDEKRASYLGTMRSEANRLGHLIDNVLGYSRLERKRSAGRMENIPAGDLLASVGPRLEERTTQAGMKLVIDSEGAEQLRLHVDVVAMEQILFNLVDNACKYAAGSEDKRIEVRVGRSGREAMFRVCDHGPGIAADQAKRLFRPFSKSVHEAARTRAPGLGLGLALSRRLARDMGGDLRLERRSGGGACFVVSVGTV